MVLVAAPVAREPQARSRVPYRFGERWPSRALFRAAFFAAARGSADGRARRFLRGRFLRGFDDPRRRGAFLTRLALSSASRQRGLAAAGLSRPAFRGGVRPRVAAGRVAAARASEPFAPTGSGAAAGTVGRTSGGRLHRFQRDLGHPLLSDARASGARCTIVKRT